METTTMANHEMWVRECKQEVVGDIKKEISRFTERMYDNLYARGGQCYSSEEAEEWIDETFGGNACQQIKNALLSLEIIANEL